MRVPSKLDRISDDAVTIYIAVIFSLMVVQMIRRGRKMDGLASALIALFSFLSMAYGGIALVELSFLHDLPLWFLWFLKIGIAVSGTAVIILLGKLERQRTREMREAKEADNG